MARMMVKQPNGKYAIFSTIIDNYIVKNATKEEIVAFLVEEKTFLISEEIENAVKFIDSPQEQKDKMEFYPRYCTGSFLEAEEARIRIHGE